MFLVGFLATRFVLELFALGALAYGGWKLGGDSVLRFLLAVALPLGGATVWGLFVAPKRPFKTGTRERLVWEAVVFIGAAAALAAVDQRWSAIALLIAWAIDRIGLELCGGLPDKPVDGTFFQG
jgi:hypothetical protein